jgi:hypothetical protein
VLDDAAEAVEAGVEAGRAAVVVEGDRSDALADDAAGPVVPVRVEDGLAVLEGFEAGDGVVEVAGRTVIVREEPSGPRAGVPHGGRAQALGVVTAPCTRD